jgi:hypothetical protein
MASEAAREYPFEQTTASKFANILGPPAKTADELNKAKDDGAEAEPPAPAKSEPPPNRPGKARVANSKRKTAQTQERDRAPKSDAAPKTTEETTAETAAATETGKASAVHIPAELEPRIRAFQRRHGGTRALSNGKLLVWAITDCHSRGRLDDLVGARNVGGDLFGAWTVTATPDHNGPTFPFTVYLPAPFYATFDELVERHGANSRSHLAALTLTDFLKHCEQHESEGTT